MYQKILSKSVVLALSVVESHYKIYLFSITLDIIFSLLHFPTSFSLFIFFIFSLPLFVHELGHIMAILKLSPETKFFVSCKNYFVKTNFQMKGIDKFRWVMGSGIIANGIVGSMVSFAIIYLNLRSTELTIFLSGNFIFLIANLLPDMGDSWVLYNSTAFRRNKKIQKTVGYFHIPIRILKFKFAKYSTQVTETISSFIIELYTSLLVRMNQ